MSVAAWIVAGVRVRIPRVVVRAENGRKETLDMTPVFCYALP